MRPIRLLALSLIPFLGLTGSARATTWTLSTINPNNPAGNRPSLRLGAQDLPRVAHWYIGVGIRYAEFDGAQWHDEPIEPSAPSNVPPAVALPNSTQLFRTVSLALALDATGNPWI